MGLIIEKQKTIEEVRPKQKEERTRRKMKDGPSQTHAVKSADSSSRWKAIQAVARDNRSKLVRRHKDKSGTTAKSSEKTRRSRGDNGSGGRDGRSLRRGEVPPRKDGTLGSKHRGGVHSPGRLDRSSSFNRNHVNNRSIRGTNSSVRRNAKAMKSPSGTPTGATRRPPRASALTATFQTLVPLAALSPSLSGPEIATRVALIACGVGGIGGVGGGGGGGDGNIIACGGGGGGGDVIRAQEAEVSNTTVCNEDAPGTKGSDENTDNLITDVASSLTGDGNTQEETGTELQTRKEISPQLCLASPPDGSDDTSSPGDGNTEEETGAQLQKEKESAPTLCFASSPDASKETSNPEVVTTQENAGVHLQNEEDFSLALCLASPPDVSKETPISENKTTQGETGMESQTIQESPSALHGASPRDHCGQTEDTPCMRDQSKRKLEAHRVSFTVYITELYAEEEDEIPAEEDTRAEGGRLGIAEEESDGGGKTEDKTHERQKMECETQRREKGGDEIVRKEMEEDETKQRWMTEDAAERSVGSVNNEETDVTKSAGEMRDGTLLSLNEGREEVSIAAAGEGTEDNSVSSGEDGEEATEREDAAQEREEGEKIIPDTEERDTKEGMEEKDLIANVNEQSVVFNTSAGDDEVERKEDRESSTVTAAQRDAIARMSEAERLHYRRQLLKAIQSLDTLNDQIVEFVFSGVDFEDERHGGSPKQREALKSSMALMRRLLVDAQSKFRKMVEDNKQLASRIDGDLQTAHQEVNLLRQELADTNRRITELTGLTQDPQDGQDSPDAATTPVNGSNHSELSSNQLVEEVSQLRLENEKLAIRNRGLLSEVEELRRVKESIVEEDQHLKPKISEMTVELTHAKEALSALKADRKRLKAEKFDLLNQMKQLYATLEDKEKELRDFIRNYEQRMKDSDESLRHLAAERDETEREKWNILKHARDESEKVVKLSAQLGLKEATVKKLQEELDLVRKQLNSVGYYSDAESVRTNGLPTPTASTPTCSPLPVATPTPTPNGRGSSADSGVRVSSDRESTASHDGGPDTPKESPSLSPLYATPAYIRAGDDQPGGGDKTPTSVQTPATMSGLANSSANAGGLSRSAEQLCERLSEAGEISKAQGTSTLMRKNHKSGGTWGSISRVFARQKKRAALDTSIYDGSGSDKRASWSPSSSLCASPLTEESYSEKLRLLEEAQHIPLERWKAPTVLAWLEVTLGMAQYGAMCAENIRSGKVLLELSDSELEAGLGITHPMHRKKLRLAIEELREPRLTRYPRISALGHTWVSSEWLPDLGLPHYSESFANSLVDGRLLDALTKKELEKHLGVHRKFHQASIIHGVHLLRIVRFDRQVLAERRRQCELVDTDPVVWTNLRWVRWARSIDLAEYADNLKDSGVHGALVVLEPSFTADTMSTALGIPQSKNIIRRHLATELESLVNPARQQLDEQARYAKMERRRQEKLASGGSLGRSFSRSYGTGLEKGDKDKRRASLRGSLSRALGLRLREEAVSGGSTNGGGESSSSGGQSPAVTTRAHPRHGHHARPRSSIMPSQAYFHHETHRRVKSIGDIETITVTPV